MLMNDDQRAWLLRTRWTPSRSGRAVAFHGGFLGVCAAVILFARQQKIDMLRLGDLTPVAPIGIFGRIANFINGELGGAATDGLFGIIFCNEIESRPTIRNISARRGPCPDIPASSMSSSSRPRRALIMPAIYRLKWLVAARRTGGDLPAGLRPDAPVAGKRPQSRCRHARVSAGLHHGDDAVSADDTGRRLAAVEGAEGADPGRGRGA